MFNQEVIDKIVESTWGRFWTVFTNFGTTTAGLIGLIIIIRGIKLIADIIIHGYALHRLFGWSLHLYPHSELKEELSKSHYSLQI